MRGHCVNCTGQAVAIFGHSVAGRLIVGMAAPSAPPYPANDSADGSSGQNGAHRVGRRKQIVICIGGQTVNCGGHCVGDAGHCVGDAGHTVGTAHRVGTRTQTVGVAGQRVGKGTLVGHMTGRTVIGQPGARVFARSSSSDAAPNPSKPVSAAP